MSKALIIVDVQHDFLPGGALGVPNGKEVVGPIIDFAVRFPGVVVGSLDWHPFDHLSFATTPEYVDGSWPVHCVQGTQGARAAGGIGGVVATFFKKGMDRDVEAYSAFDGVSYAGVGDPRGALDGGARLTDYLRSRQVDHVFVCGLALDYCVRATAEAGAAEGFKVTVLTDLTRPVAPETGREAMDAMSVNPGITLGRADYLMPAFNVS